MKKTNRAPVGFVLRTLIWFFILVPQCVRAHRTDEYLQAVLVDIEPDSVRLDLSLTPGIETFPALLPLLDADNSGQISSLESDTYAQRWISDVGVQLDGRALAPTIQSRQVPSLEELKGGLATIRLGLGATTGDLHPGLHELLIQNRHLTNLSVYLVNAIIPESRDIRIDGQVRNDNQSECRILFTRIPATPSLAPQRPVLLSVGWLVPILVFAAIGFGGWLWIRR